MYSQICRTLHHAKTDYNVYLQSDFQEPQGFEFILIYIIFFISRTFKVHVNSNPEPLHRRKT